jgi:GNAT superfamily N-acetyltransferase
MEATVAVVPATLERWPDLERLFGASGAYAGCWCMFWRLDRAQFKAQKGQANHDYLHHLLEEGQTPGLLAYVDDVIAGWCSLGSRSDFVALESSRILKRIDTVPVWSIACFYIAKPFRHHGLMRALLRAAIEYAAEQGAPALEGYPLDLTTAQLSGQKLGSYAGYMGIASAYHDVGFVEVGRASETQLIMRYTMPKT